MLKEMSITLLNQLMQPHSPLTQAAAKMDNALKSLLLFIDNHSPVSFLLKIFFDLRWSQPLFNKACQLLLDHLLLCNCTICQRR